MTELISTAVQNPAELISVLLINREEKNLCHFVCADVSFYDKNSMKQLLFEATTKDTAKDNRRAL